MKQKFSHEVDPLDSEVLLKHGYTNLEYIGHGGYSRIYKGLSNKYHKLFAIKVVDKNLPGKKLVVEAITNEVSVLEKLYHPNIVQLFESFIENDKAYIVIEYCSNGSMRHINKDRPGVVTNKLLDYFYDILSALDFIHSKGFAHSDIKTENILLDDYMRPKIADFGMAEHYEVGQTSSCFKGSMPYASPEIHSHIPYDPFKSDIWSLGISFYEMIMDKLPWPKQKELISAAIAQGGCVIPKTLPGPVQHLLRHMTNLNAKKRPSAKECMEMSVFNYKKNEEPPRLPLLLQAHMRTNTFQTHSHSIAIVNKKKIKLRKAPTFLKLAPKIEE